VYFSNLSASLFEEGQYADSITSLLSAWRLLSTTDNFESDAKAMVLCQKLSLRAAKALLHSVASQIDIDEANFVDVDKLRAVSEQDEQRKTSELEELWAQWDHNHYKGMRKKERDDDRKTNGLRWATLPRYKPFP
jgi:hypothetical protein